MDRWIEWLSTHLADRTSRRGVVGRIGRALVAAGAATLVGIPQPQAVAAACSTCGGGTCNDGQPLGCGNVGGGGCTGRLRSCSSCESGYLTGWVWYCCDASRRKWKCQDCCSAPGVYDHTCVSQVGNCPYAPSP